MGRFGWKQQAKRYGAQKLLRRQPYAVESGLWRLAAQTQRIPSCTCEVRRQYFREGKRYLDELDVLRCKIAGYWYCARFEGVLDTIERAVGLCQCRMAEEIVGRGCGRSMENCVVFGGVAELLIRHGKMRRMEKKDILEIKAEAAAAGLASFIVETKLAESIGGALCSCCGCCCGALRTISQFNAPGLIAPPHFVPKVDLAKCTYCGQCARVCPVGTTVVDVKAKLRQHLLERCIGCGLCAVNCDRKHAIQMEPTPKYRQPPKSLLSTLLQIAPNHLRNAWSV